MFNETPCLVKTTVGATMKSREEEAMRVITQITLVLSAIINLKHIKDLELNKKIPLNSPTRFLYEPTAAACPRQISARDGWRSVRCGR
jgi:hypothetical protein